MRPIPAGPWGPAGHVKIEQFAPATNVPVVSGSCRTKTVNMTITSPRTRIANKTIGAAYAASSLELILVIEKGGFLFISIFY